MDFIKNFKLISDKLPQFAEENVSFIDFVNYYIDYNNYYENASFLEVGYVYDDQLQQKRLKFVLKFNEVSSLSLSGFGGSFNQISGFKIDDLRDRNWDNEVRYYVHDYENGTMHFYCSSIEVLSVEELFV